MIYISATKIKLPAEFLGGLILFKGRNRLSYTEKSSETYWSLFKCFLNNTKIFIILPLFYESNFVVDFKEKTELFNTFFVK